MKMELSLKNAKGEVIAHRGKRRVMVDGVLKNEWIGEKTGEWVSKTALVSERAELVKLAELKK